MRRWLRGVAALLAAAPFILYAAAPEEPLFAPVTAVRARAEAAQAALLAPQSYGEGIGALERAQAEYQRGSAGEKLQARLAEARAFFQQAIRNAGVAQVQLAPALAAREAARTAEAFRLAAAGFAAAERKLQEAARRLERGDARGAAERSEEARRSYSEAELDAIRAALLTEARAAVLAMDSVNAERHAPKTAARARALLQQADAALVRDRSQREEPQRLAREAATEARHAVALAAMLEQARARDATPEDLVQEWEGSTARIAGAAGTTADFSEGPRAAAEAVARAVAGLRESAAQQARDLVEQQRQIAALEEEIRDLDTRLSGASAEARTLSLRLEAGERSRQQFRQLEQVFTAEEATVLRESDRIVVRLHGLNFAPGASSLSPTGIRLAEKLGRVAALYPAGGLLVEGHTDASGDRAANQRLSQARAETVRRYMVEVLKVAAGRVRAIGYGDSRPIASNATAEGRRQNRRIDLVIPVRPEEAP